MDDIPGLIVCSILLVCFVLLTPDEVQRDEDE